MRFGIVGWLIALIALWANIGVVQAAQATQELGSCMARIVSIQAARADAAAPELRPTEGWVTARAPEVWARRWRQWNGSVWYRIDWERPSAEGCPSSEAEPVAFGMDGVSVAGEVFSNQDLLWRDASLVEPLSRSWNIPRWWVLPPSSLHEGINSVWIRAVGPASVSAGIGAVRVGTTAMVIEQFDSAMWRQRTLYFINAVLCAMAASLFLLVWGLSWRSRQQQGGELTQAYGWFGLMALCWLAYLSTYLAQTQWPWPDSITRSRFSSIALIGYALCVCKFTFRFGGQKWPKIELGLYILAALGVAAVVLPPDTTAMYWTTWVWQATMAVVFINGLQFQWHAWRPKANDHKVAQRLLALCWLVFVVIGAATLFKFVDLWQVARYWAALSGLSVIGLVMLLLGAQLVRQMRKAESFNHLLSERVDEARVELAQALTREHSRALENAKLQERIQLAYDLHDSLGGGLVRGMALVEQAQAPLSNDRVLSLLKNLRDDLRQLIDQGSSAGATVPATPLQWAAPVRHRFSSLFDAMGMSSHWLIAPQWSPGYLPSPVQCMALTRLLEEALSNVVKHSQAQRVQVVVELSANQDLDIGLMVIRIEDDGCGFDVDAVHNAGLSVGMRSMAARAKRIGAQWQVESSPGSTVVSINLVLGPE